MYNFTTKYWWTFSFQYLLLQIWWSELAHFQIATFGAQINQIYVAYCIEKNWTSSRNLCYKVFLQSTSALLYWMTSLPACLTACLVDRVLDWIIPEKLFHQGNFELDRLNADSCVLISDIITARHSILTRGKQADFKNSTKIRKWDHIILLQNMVSNTSSWQVV